MESPHANLFYTKQVEAEKNGEKVNFDIETKDMQGRPDCRIGNFYRNFWFRTKKAQNYQGYKTAGQLEKAVRLSLQKRGFINIKFLTI